MHWINYSYFTFTIRCKINSYIKDLSPLCSERVLVIGPSLRSLSVSVLKTQQGRFHINVLKEENFRYTA